MIITAKVIGQFKKPNEKPIENKKLSPPRKYYVYFIWNKTKDMIKIGISNSYLRRLSEHSFLSPKDTLTYLGSKVFSDKKEAQEHEKSLHKKFEKIRIKGEWYNGTIFREFLSCTRKEDREDILERGNKR